ncbi:hypothetical protein NDA16_004221 [Ustilago loliicola]|nr:hypothetical protein NDA16_004221 [Ustilago loliicola]
MKKFFKTKEAGAITPLPPTSPAASTSTFGTPRPFEEYQARVASQGDLHRPLSYQAPSASSRSVRGSSDENGYAYPSSQHRRSQQYGASDPIQHSSPVKHHFSNHVHATHAAPESAYESYSDPRRRSDDYDEEEDERTPTAGACGQRSAAYPVYSGAEGDEDDGEVLISQGRYEETVLKDLPSKDKKGKKLFGFATGGNKDKKPKDERERAAASSPIPRGSRERVHDDAGLMSPPLDHAHDRNKDREGGWIDRWNKRAHQHQEARLADKEAEELVSSKVGWIASSANTEEDWMQILSLIDVIAQSDAASKEAARALRKEFKYGSVDTQRRAVRVWALLTLNGSDRFRQQVASKKFLEAVEDTIASSKTPLSVKETMLRVLGVLAFEFRDDADLAGVTKCWNKVKPNDRLTAQT